MLPVLPALLAFRRRRGTSHETASALLASGCHVLSSTPPALISAASISCPLSSAQEGDLLAAQVHQLAAEHRLVAKVTVGRRLLRATFARLDGVPEPSDGAG